MKNEQVKNAAAKAADLAKLAPPEFRGEAFNVLFMRLLDQEIPSTASFSASPKKAVSRPDHQNREELLDEILRSDIDFSLYHDLLESGSWVERIIIALYVLEKALGIQSITPPELATVLTDKLRLPNVHAPNISRALAGNMQYFVRSPEGQAFKYSLSTKGISYLKRILKQEESNGES